MTETVDRFGATWPQSYVLCPECKQPDNCGDCTHEPLTDAQVLLLGGSPARASDASRLEMLLELQGNADTPEEHDELEREILAERASHEPEMTS